MTNTADSSRFNPKDHLIKLPRRMRTPDGQWKTVELDYLEVRWRLVWLREDHPEAQIDTEILQVDEVHCIVRARVTVPGGGMATGLGYSTPDKWKEGYIEKTECLPDAAEILTRSGFKHHSAVSLGELVAAYDMQADEVRWTPLLRKVTYPAAPLLRLHNSRFDATCTPDHTWVVRDYAGRRMLREASDLRANDQIIIAAACHEGEPGLSERDAALIGWGLTDGTLKRSQTGAASSLIISQSKPDTTAEIRALVGTSGHEMVGHPTVRTFPGGRSYRCLPQHSFRLGAVETRRLFGLLGTDQPAEVPAAVTRLGFSQRMAMLNAMMHADGDKRGTFGKKRKPGVMEGWRLLATLCGLALGLPMRSSAGDVPLQRLKLCRTVYGSALRRQVVEPGAVWCPTTTYGTWIARLPSGQITITGNTKALGRALAALGYGTQFCEDFEDEGQNLADSPVEQRQPTAIAEQPRREHQPVTKPAAPSPAVAGAADERAERAFWESLGSDGIDETAVNGLLNGLTPAGYRAKHGLTWGQMIADVRKRHQLAQPVGNGRRR